MDGHWIITSVGILVGAVFVWDLKRFTYGLTHRFAHAYIGGVIHCIHNTTNNTTNKKRAQRLFFRA
ncbi:hypothetical protein [Listeria booriae]|uniref:hypothetical protein n=1 Tax=Listeria booriae TaxID=1552123 RepID=UPI0016286CD5|nr:hypothetical protein [Listeria booriae]MBC1984699.1 hypothetical protein [Listeria booriae]